MKTKLRTATIIPYARLQSQGARDYASVSEWAVASAKNS